MFIDVVNSIVAGTLGALIAEAAGAPTWLIAVVGAVVGLGYLSVALAVAQRWFRGEAHESRFPTPKR